MSKCKCLSAPDYHRTDCPIFDEYGRNKINSTITITNNCEYLGFGIPELDTLFVNGITSGLHSFILNESNSVQNIKFIENFSNKNNKEMVIFFNTERPVVSNVDLKSLKNNSLITIFEFDSSFSVDRIIEGIEQHLNKNKIIVLSEIIRIINPNSPGLIKAIYRDQKFQSFFHKIIKNEIVFLLGKSGIQVSPNMSSDFLPSNISALSKIIFSLNYNYSFNTYHLRIIKTRIQQSGLNRGIIGNKMIVFKI